MTSAPIVIFTDLALGPNEKEPPALRIVGKLRSEKGILQTEYSYPSQRFITRRIGDQGWRARDCSCLPSTWRGFGPRVG